MNLDRALSWRNGDKSTTHDTSHSTSPFDVTTICLPARPRRQETRLSGQGQKCIHFFSNNFLEFKLDYWNWGPMCCYRWNAESTLGLVEVKLSAGHFAFFLLTAMRHSLYITFHGKFWLSVSTKTTRDVHGRGENAMVPCSCPNISRTKWTRTSRTTGDHR